MMKKLLASFLGFLLITSCSQDIEEQVSSKIFNQLTPDQTEISFSNDLNENDSINYFTYGYIYMGGGVAAGDLNNDGLPELFFTANMKENKLYLNRGDMQFQDISEQAGVEGDDRWITGVTMADVNSDGWLDLYVCAAGLYGNKQNLLYINQGVDADGIPAFKELAHEFGVADEGQSTHATFLDYDLDGDLDLYVGNYPITDFKSPYSHYRQMMDHITWKDSDHFYRNNGDQTFTDITEEAGLLSYGLTLSTTVGDFNQDGYPDIYVSNDFASPDYFYFNTGEGSFEEKCMDLTSHTSFYGMGVDIADFNNDGLLDIAQMDMTPEDNRRSKANMASMNPEGFKEMINLGLHHQYMKNVLQVNSGFNSEGYPLFSDVSYMAGVDATDWSWASLLADFDNDGLKDLFVTNGTRRDINNKDFFIDLTKNNSNFFGEVKVDNKLDVVMEMPSEKIDNYIFKNNGDLTFSRTNIEWGVEFAGFSNGATYVDLNRDGDLDLVVNNIDGPASVFENLTSDQSRGNYIEFRLNGPEGNVFGLGTKVSISHNGVTQFNEVTLSRGFQSSVEPLVHFGLAKDQKVDELLVIWPNGKTQRLEDLQANQVLTLDYNDAEMVRQDSPPARLQYLDITEKLGIDYHHHENDYNDYRDEVLLPHQTSRLGPALATADINNDGLDDFYIGGASGQNGMLYVQQENGTFLAIQESLWHEDAEKEDTGAAFFDVNNDGFQDLYVVSGGNEFEDNDQRLQDRLYLNDAKGGFIKLTAALPTMYTSGASVAYFDYDKDGDLDLFVGGRLTPGSYPVAPRSYLLENVSNAEQVKFNDVTESVGYDLKYPGMVTSAVWLENEYTELVLAGEWMPVSVYRYVDGEFRNMTKTLGLEHSSGWWFSLAKFDFDHDGDMDLIGGNLGLNYKYQASEEASFDIYSADFDENGNLDIVLSYYNEGIQFPVRGRQCSSEQIPAIKKKFANYNDFAVADVSEVYTQNALENALHYQVLSFASSFIENKGDHYQLVPLPNIAQVSSIHGIITGDFNHDDKADIFLAGNFYVSEIETPRDDAGRGLVLFGDNAGDYRSIPASETTPLPSYDTRNAVKLRTAKGSIILLANNDQPLKAIKVIMGSPEGLASAKQP